MIKVSYWSGSGNTMHMAENIVVGAKEAGQEVEVLEVSKAKDTDVINADLVVLGCPAMGCEELDDTEMLPFLEANESNFKGKRVALFGSYGWGNGEWMESWKEQMEGYGATVMTEPLIINEFTIGQDEAVCHDYGKQLV